MAIYFLNTTSRIEVKINKIIKAEIIATKRDTLV